MSAARWVRRGALALVFGCPLAGLVIPARATAQAPVARASAGVHFESYSFAAPGVTGASSISLLTVPFAARVAVTHGLSIEAAGAYARATVSAFGTDLTLSGPTDVELRATAAVQRGQTTVAFAGVGIVPSGHERLGLEELVVAGAVASDLLPFHVSNWGTGGGAGGDLTIAQGFEGGSVGLSAGYRVASAFRPFHVVDLSYRPGNELRVGAGLERTLAGDQTVLLQLSYARFGEDLWEGVNLFHTGARVLAMGGYTAPLGSGTASLYGGVLYRSGGALAENLSWVGVLTGMEPPPSETLVLLGSSARLPWRSNVLVPSLDFRALRRSDGTGQGVLVGVGAAAELRLGGGARLVPSARARLGRLLVSEGAASGVRGFEVGLGLQLGGAR